MSSSVLIALRVDAAQQRAFDVFVRDIGAWWQPNGLFRTSDRPGVLAFRGAGADARAGAPTMLVETAADGTTFEIGQVRVWEPPQRLVFGWRQVGFPAELATEVEVRFDAVSAGVTRVSVRHRGFHQVPEDSAARHGFPDHALQLRLAEWWHILLQRFSDHVA